MKYIKLLWFDIRNGIVRKPMLFAIPAIISIISCIDLTNRISSLNELHYFETQIKGSFADYMMYLYGGMDQYVPAQGNSFVFPVRWTVVVLTILFLTLNYPYKDMQSFGQQILIRTQGRAAWWLSKCGWNILNVLIYHSIFFGTTLLFCGAVQGSFSQEINKSLQYVAFRVDIPPALSDDTLWPFVMLILPVFVSLGINLLQMTLSLFIKPMFSFFAVAFWMISSAYLTSSFLIGNYAMTMRYQMVMKGGVGMPAGIIGSIALIILSVGIGMLRFHTYDILNEEQEGFS